MVAYEIANKNIIIANTPQEFSEAVIRVLQNEDGRTALEKEAQLFAENEFDNKKVVSGLVEFYKNTLHV